MGGRCPGPIFPGSNDRTLHVRVHVDKEGQATFRMPREFAGQDVDLVVVFEPVKAAEGLG